MNREVRGMELTFTVLKKRKLLVPTDGPSLNLIVEHLGGRKGEARRKAEETVMFVPDIEECDHGRVRWCRCPSALSHGRFSVEYLDDSGKRRGTTAGLNVPVAVRQGRGSRPWISSAWPWAC